MIERQSGGAGRKARESAEGTGAVWRILRKYISANRDLLELRIHFQDRHDTD